MQTRRGCAPLQDDVRLAVEHVDDVIAQRQELPLVACSQVLIWLLHGDETVRTRSSRNTTDGGARPPRRFLSQFNSEAFLKRTLRNSCIPLQGPDGDLVRPRQLMLASWHAAAQYQRSYYKGKLTTVSNALQVKTCVRGGGKTCVTVGLAQNSYTM
jgi:hypothetical protein